MTARQDEARVQGGLHGAAWKDDNPNAAMLWAPIFGGV